MPYRVTLLFGGASENQSDQGAAVNHYRPHAISRVETGQILARLDPLPEPPEASGMPTGVDFLAIKDKTVIENPTIELREEGPLTYVVSRGDGFAALSGEKIIVSTVLTIPGDINFHTGNLDCPGDLIIEGSIMSGFKVTAENLTVYGSIENAVIKARGNLICRGGIVGCHDQPLLCGANLWCKYLENSSIEVKNNIFIARSSLHSNMKAGGDIVLCQNSAVLVGGRSEAGRSIYCGISGAKWETPTELILGREPFLEKRYHLFQQKLHKLEMELQELIKRIEQINMFTQSDTPPAEDQNRQLQEERELLENKSKFIKNKQQNLSSQVQDLQRKITAYEDLHHNSAFTVTNQVFRGTNLTIQKSQYHLENETKAASYREINGIIVNSALNCTD
ncbi:MAG: DUF342 domain-containing protein [Deltaproteobacteria bacterium]|nr:DUF342 domain-containing protein [Deltaproteobacteria bacterium]